MIPERLSRLYKLFTATVIVAMSLMIVSFLISSFHHALQIDAKNVAERPINREKIVVQWADDTGLEYLKHSCVDYDRNTSHTGLYCTLVGRVGSQKYVIPLRCNMTEKGCTLEPGTVQITQGE